MIPSHLTSQLASAADTAIDTALLNGAPGQRTPTGEVGFVAAVVVGAVYDIAHRWRAILRPHRLSVRMTGVFCHQAPRASFTDASGATRHCELSDLLVVVDDLATRGRRKRWATLIQAKMAKAGGGKTLSTAGDLVQLDLMTRWPPFTLPSSYAPGARDFSTCSHAGTILECGRYGLIEGQPKPSWHQQVPANSMPAGGDTLGSFIAHMVEAGQSGYGREATGMTDDWSRTVDELMRVTSAQAFNYATGFAGSQQRGHSAIAFVANGDLPPQHFPDYRYSSRVVRELLPSGGKPEGPDSPGGEPDGEGISLLRIGVTRRGDE